METQQMKSNRGFLILAHGKTFYLKWAYNLALSIKYFTDIPICLVTDLPMDDIDASGINDAVDSITHSGGLRPFHAKTWLPELTPFDETVYLDADSLCINNPEHIFDEMPDDVDFATHVYTLWTHDGRKDCSMIWADLEKLWQYYNINKYHLYPETNSSIIYFRKTDRVKRLFELAEILYSENPFPDYHKQTFAFYPDELAFNTAYAITGFQPRWQHEHSPIYFHGNTHGLMDVKKVVSQKTFISLYGVDSTHGMLYKLYDKKKNEMFTKKYGHHGVKVKREMKAVKRSGNYERHQPFKEFDQVRFKKIIDELK